MRRRIGQGLLGVLTLMLAGCGDGDSEPDPNATGGAGHGGEDAGGAGGTTGGSAGKGGTAGEGEAGEAGAGGTSGIGGGPSTGGAGAAGDAGEGGAGGGDGCAGAPQGDCPCVRVSPDGDDALATDNDGTTAFRSVGAAVDFADAHRDVAVDVCVAGGSDCSAFSSYPGPSGADFEMKDGISVYGSYESAGWTRCDETTTELAPATLAGVAFFATVENATTLSGFRISPPLAAGMTGVTVDGARNVRLERVETEVILAPFSTIGVDVREGGDVSVEASRFEHEVTRVSGIATGNAYGVRVIGGTLTLRDSFVRAATFETPAAYAVWLQDSSDSEIDGSELVAESVRGLDPNDNPVAFAALHVTGSAQGLDVHDSFVSASADAGNPVAIELVDCTSGDPWIRDNRSIVCEGPTATAIRARENCNPTIQGNDLVAARGAMMRSGTGIECTANSLCSILDNDDIHAGEALGFTPATPFFGVGISCSEGSCAEISRNIVTGLTQFSLGCSRTCTHSSYGIVLNGSTALVDANNVSQGCGTGAGLRAVNSPARIQNNILSGRDPSCQMGDLGRPLPESFGLLTGAPGPDVHSNLLDGSGSPLPLPEFTCRSAGASGPGTYRNNILSAGRCTDSSNAYNAGDVFSHNQFLPNGTEPIYESGSTQLFTEAELDQVLGGDNFTSDSVIDMGTPEGAPDHDFAGRPRNPATPDVGPTEYGDYCPEEDCSGFGVCLRSVGEPPMCQCNEGYRRPSNDPLSCVVDVCYQNGGCDPLVSCTVVSGAAVCGDCPAGYQGSGNTACVDIDECLTTNGGCDPLTTCTNTVGGRTCGPCPPGYDGNGVTGCTANPCLVNNGGCDPLTTCTLAGGDAECGACPPGYSGDGASGCNDVDECLDDNGGCDPLTQCTNVDGGRTCGDCPPDYTGNGEVGCTPIDYCETNPCQHGAVCVVEGGDYACQCPPGIMGRNCELTFTALASAQSRICGIRSDGSLNCFGFVDSGSPPAGRFQAIAAGWEHWCAVRDDGQTLCWGYSRSTETIPPAGAFSAVAASDARSCGLRTNGGIACWGLNTLDVAGSFLGVATGMSSRCAIASDRSLFCWPENTAPIAGTFKSITMGPSHGCGIRLDDTLACWGSNSSGQATPPTGTFRGVASGFHNYSCAIRTSDDTLACWGNMPGGGSPPVGAFKLVSTGPHSPCAVRTDDTVVCWGESPFVPPSGGS